MHVKEHLGLYQVETRGVYIQDVVLPRELVEVLTEREIANQNIETFKMEKEAEDQRIARQQSMGTADMQLALAKSQVEVEINMNKAKARKAEADGEATYIEKTGAAHGAKIRAVGLARAEGYEAQVRALGQIPTALVNAINALSEGNMKIIPDVLVTGGNGGSGSLEGLAATLIKKFTPPPEKEVKPKKETEPPARVTQVETDTPPDAEIHVEAEIKKEGPVPVKGIPDFEM
jgi:uncharacterized membrane protein YqiK